MLDRPRGRVRSPSGRLRAVLVMVMVLVPVLAGQDLQQEPERPRIRSKATSWPSREDGVPGPRADLERYRRRRLDRYRLGGLVADEAVRVLPVAHEQEQELLLLLLLELEPSPPGPATMPVPPRHRADPRSRRPRPRQRRLP